MDSPVISIIVPVYKVEKYLEKCIVSILQQTFKNFELILVDDGSPDNCPAICDEFAKKDNRIIVIHKNNGGLSDARNAGLSIAKGQYIGFVDGDDYIERNMYELLLDEIVLKNADMAVCNYKYVDEQYQSIENRNNNMPINAEILGVDEYLNRLIGKCGWYYVPAWNKLYNKSIFNDIKFPKGKQHEDEFLIHRIVYRCNSIVCLRQSLYNYVQRSSSIMNQRFNPKNMDYGDALIDRYFFSCFKKNVGLRLDTVKKLTHELDKWEKYAQSDMLCKSRYNRVRRKSLFLLFERSAWDDYNIRGKMFMRLHLIAPWLSQVFEKVLKLSKKLKE